MAKPENTDRIIKIGNKPDEVYIKLVEEKLIKHPYLYVKVLDNPRYLSKFNYHYSVLLNYGIVRMEQPIKIEEPNRDNNGVIQVVVFKLEVIPRILKWREDMKKSDLYMLGVG